VRVSSLVFKPETHTFFRGFNLKEVQDFLSSYPSRISLAGSLLIFKEIHSLYKKPVLLTITLLYEEVSNGAGR
jgi:hypothetical protein